MTAAYKAVLTPKGIADAEPRARPILEQAQARLGFVPNMYAVMANSPGLLDTYVHGYALFRNESGFTPAEQEVVFLTVSCLNGCEYCVAAHSRIADTQSKVAPEVTDAIRDGRPVPDPRLAALHRFTSVMFDSRGRPTHADADAFLAAGFTERHVLEIVLAIAVKTLSNYANHLFDTRLDAAFESRAWSPAG